MIIIRIICFIFAAEIVPNHIKTLQLMETLKSKLQNLITDFVVDCSIDERATGGYKVRFYHLIPTDYLTKLIALCQLYNYSYYISAGLSDGILEFQIYR